MSTSAALEADVAILEAVGRADAGLVCARGAHAVFYGVIPREPLENWGVPVVATLERQYQQAADTRRLALVLDIDGTVLDAGRDGRVRVSEDARAVAAVAREARARGWAIYFVTARTEVRDVGRRTTAQLEAVGFGRDTYDELYLMPESVWDHGTPTEAAIANYKEAARADIAARFGVALALAIGNVFGDGIALPPGGSAVSAVGDHRGFSALPVGEAYVLAASEQGAAGVTLFVKVRDA